MEIVLVDDSDVGLLANSLLIGQTFPDASLVFFKYPEAALRYAEIPSAKKQLWLVDYRMPNIDGIHFMQTVRKNHYTDHRYFILFTIEARTDLEERAIRAGYDDIMSKNDEPEDIVRKIKNALKIMQSM